MRVAVSILMILMFLLNLSCTAINVQVEYARGSRGAKGLPHDLPPIDIAPTDQASLPHLPPCLVDKAALCPPGVATGLVEPCNAPAPEKTLAQAQKTTDWCWAASASVVMNAHDKGVTQCEGVNQVLNRGDCCNFVGEFNQPPRECRINGWPYDIFNPNDFDWEYVDGPLDKETIAGQLCRYGPFIFVLELKGGGYHTLVVKSLEWTDGKTYLYVDDHSWIGNDDPFGGGPPTGFLKWSYEDFEKGLWLDVKHKNIRSFVAIRPL